MRIGYFIPEFPGQTHGFFWREIAGLEALGHEVRLISTRVPPRGIISQGWADAAMARTAYLTRLDAGDIPAAIARLPRFPLRPLLRARDAGTLRTLAEGLVLHPFAAKLARLCAREGIAHVHVASCARAALVAALARAIGGVPYSLTLHSPLRVFGGLQRLKWGGAAFGTVITETLLGELRAALPGALPDLLPVQAMGVDTTKFCRSHEYVPWTPGGELRLFSCGRLHPIKGHQVLLRAAGLLRGQGIDARLEIAGEDESGGSGFRRVLEAEIAAQGLGTAVTLLGAVDEAIVLDRLNRAHAFVLASLSEPLGVAYMEAMSCETPAIGTDAGGVRELITHGETGLLVAPGSAEAIVEAIGALTGDPERTSRIRQAARAAIVARFTSAAGARTLSDCLAATGAARA